MTALTDIPIRLGRGGFNPEGLVQAVKQCPGCGDLIYWCHYPAEPAAHEPPQERCSDCDPDAWGR